MADEEYEVVVQDDPSEVVKVEAILGQVKASINSNQLAAALKLAATTFPANLKAPQLRQQIVDVFQQMFQNFPATDAFLKELNQEQRANILKYACKVMAGGDAKACAGSLGYHTAIVRIDGFGVVNRVLVERRA
jgi:uncharacterized membrane-anchored protein YjiN (DUF445 family)